MTNTDSMTDTDFQTPLGVLTLKRFPVREADRLRAWDAADELLVKHLHDEQGLLSADCRVLVFDDQFGAITAYICQALSASDSPIVVDVITDSLISQSAILQNLEANGFDATNSQIRFLSSTGTPTERYGLIVYKLPRNHSYFADIMCRLRGSMDENTKIVGGAMVKYLPLTVLDLLGHTIGKTTTSLATKKARLIYSAYDKELAPDNPYPTSYDVEELDIQLINHSNVFSRDSIDIGTRLLLAVMPESDNELTVVDLACGNGVVAISSALLNPKAKYILCDESNMAVMAARENFTRCLPEREAEFIQADCLDGIEHNSVDLVLCNPPFHQQNSVSEHIGWQMFKESLQCLKPGGQLWVVGNRHLGYHVKLKKLFGNALLVDSNKKFVVIKSIKR